MKEPAFSAEGFMKEADTLPELIPRHGPSRGCFLNLGDALLKRARQIAGGRVIAGVHYTIDTEAGLALGELLSLRRSKHQLDFRRTWRLPLQRSSSRWAFLHELSPFIRGLTLFFWVTGTWWIPLLIIIAVWRHGVTGVPIGYSAQTWTLVFPLGMYTVATDALAEVTGLKMLTIIPKIMVYAALAGWIFAFFGMLRKMFKPVPQPA